MTVNQIIRKTSKGQLVPLQFMQDAVAASQTNAQLEHENGQLALGYEMPFAGEIVAISFLLSAAGSAGVFTIGATINGTEDADTTITVGTDASNSKKVARGLAPFSVSEFRGLCSGPSGSLFGRPQPRRPFSKARSTGLNGRRRRRWPVRWCHGSTKLTRVSCSSP